MFVRTDYVKLDLCREVVPRSLPLATSTFTLLKQLLVTLMMTTMTTTNN